MKANKVILLLLPLALALDACDTASNTERPTNDYYVKYIGKEGDQTGVDMEVNADGTLILLGTTRIDGGSSQLWIVKTDGQGNVIWEKELGGPLDDEASDIELTDDGGMVILGNSYRRGSAGNGSRDIFIATLTADGSVVDSVTFGYQIAGTGADADEHAVSVTQTDDGFVVAGSSDRIYSTDLASVRRDPLSTRLNRDLTPYDITWQYPPTFQQGDESETTKIFQLPSKTFYEFGYSRFSDSGVSADLNFWYFDLGMTGVPLGGTKYSGAPNVDERISAVQKIPSNGGYFLAGTVVVLGGNYDCYIGRLREPLAFNDGDVQFGPRPVGLNLGHLQNDRVSVYVSPTEEFFILCNDASGGNNNFRLTRLDPAKEGDPIWSRVFGGQGDDFIGSVRELPDGKLVLFGTMSLGQPPGEPKMVLIKVNKDGQFAK